MRLNFLEEALTDLAIIRTTLEALNSFPTENPIRSEMEEIISDARDNLSRRNRDLLENFQANPSFLELDFEQFKVSALRMMMRGYPAYALNSMFKTPLFNESVKLYFYRTCEGDILEEAQKMSGSELFETLIRDLLKSIEDESNYKNNTAFDTNVFQKYEAFLFICISSNDLFFYSSV